MKVEDFPYPAPLNFHVLFATMSKDLAGEVRGESKDLAGEVLKESKHLAGEVLGGASL